MPVVNCKSRVDFQVSVFVKTLSDLTFQQFTTFSSAEAFVNKKWEFAKNLKKTRKRGKGGKKGKAEKRERRKKRERKGKAKKASARFLSKYGARPGGGCALRCLHAGMWNK